MHIEERLESIDTSLKALLAAMQSGLQMQSVSDTATSDEGDSAETTKRKRRTKAEIAADEAAAAAAKTAPVLEGDAPGTRYWVSETLGQVYTEAPGQPVPDDQSFKIETAEHYAAKKAEFAAKKTAAETTAASSAPAAAQAAAPAASTSGVSWDEVITALKGLATDPAHGADAVLKIVKQIDPNAANVPALKAMNKNAEILAAVAALKNPAPGGDPLFG